MPTKAFRVNIFNVEEVYEGNGQPTAFAEAIQTVRRLDLALRERSSNGKARRLDTYDVRDNLFLLNFITFEYAGPGRAQRGRPTQAIPLQRDESFAPETSMLFDPATGLAFVESSLGGMSAGAVAGYFQRFADTGNRYTMIPRADQNATTRARRLQIIRSLKMRMALGAITAADNAAGIGPIKGFGTEYGAAFVDVELKTDRPRDRSLLRGRAQEFIAQVTGGNVDIPLVLRLEITGKEHDDQPVEIIDLIQHREKRQMALEIDAETRRVPFRDRWNALVHIRALFLQG